MCDIIGDPMCLVKDIWHSSESSAHTDDVISTRWLVSEYDLVFLQFDRQHNVFMSLVWTRRVDTRCWTCWMSGADLTPQLQHSETTRWLVIVWCDTADKTLVLGTMWCSMRLMFVLMTMWLILHVLWSCDREKQPVWKQLTAVFPSWVYLLDIV